MIGMRPRECWTATRISSLCSSKSTVGDSPVVPTTTMPSVPSSTCQSMSLRKRGRSSFPSSSIGVTIATRLPVIMGAILTLRQLDGTNALRDRGLRALDLPFFKSQYVQGRKNVEELPGPQQEFGVGGPAEALVAGHKG